MFEGTDLVFPQIFFLQILKICSYWLPMYVIPIIFTFLLYDHRNFDRVNQAEPLDHHKFEDNFKRLRGSFRGSKV